MLNDRNEIQRCCFSTKELIAEQKLGLSFLGHFGLSPTPLNAKTNNHIDLLLKNTGKTPALQVVYKYRTWIQVSGKTIAELEKVGSSETVYGPGDVRPTILSWTSPMSQEQVDMLESKKGTFFVDIEFMYRDIFDSKHHTRACLFYDPIISSNLALAFCDHGCYMD